MVYIMARGLILQSFSFKCHTMSRTKLGRAADHSSPSSAAVMEE